MAEDKVDINCFRIALILVLIIFMFVISTFIISMFITSSTVMAEEFEKDKDTYILDAENISYGYQKRSITAAGDVIFKFKDLEVNAEKLVLDLEKELVTAEGDDILLSTKTEEITGNYLEYNYKTGKGIFYGASSNIDQLNFKGGEIELNPDREYQYNIEQASLTPCILPDPHYQIKAESIQIYPGDKILGKKVQFWWGDQRLITLPYYVMEYRKIVEEDGEEREIIVNPIPLPQLGFDSRQGLVFTLIYPYYLGEKSSGEITASSSQQGEQSVNIDNTYYFNETTVVENELKHEKVKNDNGWQQNTDYYGYLKYKKPFYELYTGFHYQREEETGTSKNNGSVEDKKLLETGLNYKKGDLSFSPQLAYNLDSGDREEKMRMDYNPGSFYQFNLFQKYLNENLEQHSYSINSKDLPLDWELIYRDGYEVDYYPYLKLTLPSFYDINTVIGAGKVTNEGVNLNKAQMTLDYAKSFTVTDNIELDFNEKLIYNLYEQPLQAAASQVLNSRISARYKNNVREDIDFGLKFYWQYTATSGDFLLEADETDDRSILGSSIDIGIATPEPQSKWNLETAVKYDLEEEQWDDISLGITREFDCYSLSFNYNHVDEYFSFDFEI